MVYKIILFAPNFDLGFEIDELEKVKKAWKDKSNLIHQGYKKETMIDMSKFYTMEIEEIK